MNCVTGFYCKKNPEHRADGRIWSVGVCLGSGHTVLFYMTGAEKANLRNRLEGKTEGDVIIEHGSEEDAEFGQWLDGDGL